MERRILAGWALRGLLFAGIALWGFLEAWGVCGPTVGTWTALAPAAVGQRAVPAMVIPVADDQKKEEEADQKDQKEGSGLEKGVDIFVPPPREVMKNLFAAQRLLEQGRLSEAVGFLQTLLTHPEDYFFQPDPSQPTRRSLKNEALRLLGQLPEEARQIYELRYGPLAVQGLREAVAEGDPEKLSEISRTFYHTQAGYEATLLLGLHHLRSGRVLAAALVLDRLLQSSAHPERLEPTLSLALATAWYRAQMPEHAQAVLIQLKAKRGGKPLQVAGREMSWFSREQDALSWLERWAGRLPLSASRPPETEDRLVRSASGWDSRPLMNYRWRLANAEHPLLDEWIEYMRSQLQDQGFPCMSLGIPLAVGNTVLIRTLEKLVAVDLRTGKRLWESPFEGGGDILLPEHSPGMYFGQASTIQARLLQRLFLDATYSRLSSDGKLVFCVEEDSAWERPLSPGRPPILIMRQRMKEGRSTLAGNRLVAYDIRTGKLQWELGGPPDQEYPLPLAGTAFLGPPLPLMGQLYVLGEMGNDVRLLVLEAQTGRLLWSQQVGMSSLGNSDFFGVEGPIITSRLLGLSPLYADGILVCPIGTGSLVALDLAHRTFLWAYASTPSLRDAQQRRMFLIQQVLFGGLLAPAPTDGWRTTTCHVAEGRVVFTTPEGPEIYCLNLTDGKQLWSRSYADGVYVAGVYDGKVLWVGRRRLGAIRLADGQPAWPAQSFAAQTQSSPFVQGSDKAVGKSRLDPSTALAGARSTEASPPDLPGREFLTLPDGAMPTGIGFGRGDKYYLPLSTGEVATIDLTKGEIIHRTRSWSDALPGNLICVGDKVLSQGPGAVELYEQLEPLRARTEAQLAKNPEDAEALAIWGEIMLEDGRRAEAIEAFRRSLTRRDDARTRQFLRETLFEALQEDFAAYQQHRAELEKLLESSEDRRRYDRLLAEGFLQIKDYRSAWETAQNLAERKEQLTRLEPISDFHTVRGDRWLADHLKRLLDQTSGELRQQIDREIQEQLTRAIQGPDPVGQLTAFLNLYGQHPLADQARQELLSRLISGGRWLEVEMLLREQAESAQPETQRAAIAQLADLLRRAGRPAEAAAYYQQLLRQWPDTVCLGGKTGRQLVQAVPADDPVHRFMQPTRWPQGRVEIHKSTAPTSGPAGVMYGRIFLSEIPSEQQFTGIQIVYDQNRRMLLGYDRFGRDMWKPFPVSLSNPNQFLIGNRMGWRFQLLGNLMLVSNGAFVGAYDLLGISGSGGLRQLWLLDPIQLRQTEADEGLKAFGMKPWHHIPGRVGNCRIIVGSNRLVCVHLLRHLMAVDALTGKTIWQRSDVPVGAMIFGDRQRILLVPPEKNEVLILRTSDGKLVGRRTLQDLLPPSDRAEALIVPPHMLPQLLQHPPEHQGAFLRDPSLVPSGSRFLLWYPETLRGASPSEAGAVQAGAREPKVQVLRLYDPWEQKDFWGPLTFSEGTRAMFFPDHAIGLLEPEGHFTLLRIADGQVRIKDTLEIQDFGQGLQGIHVLDLEELTLVIPWGVPAGFQQKPQQMLPGTNTVPLPFARVYAYNVQGQRLWPKPLELQHQNLLLSQPSGLPVVIFATQLFEQRGQGGTFHVHLLAIDKQTGRKVLEEKLPHPTNIFQITGDPEKHTVDILLQRDKITLTFTDEPWPAEQPASPEAASDKEKSAAKKPTTLREGLWRSIRKAFLPEKPSDSFEESDLEDNPALPAQAFQLPGLLPVPVPDTR